MECFIYSFYLFFYLQIRRYQPIIMNGGLLTVEDNVEEIYEILLEEGEEDLVETGTSRPLSRQDYLLELHSQLSKTWKMTIITNNVFLNKKLNDRIRQILGLHHEARQPQHVNVITGP